MAAKSAKNSRRVIRFKTQRRLGTELPGLGKPGALDRRPYPPGENGNKRRKYSDYALRLEAKQKIRFHYNIKEKQLRNFIKKAKKGSATNWANTLAGLLERRLDNIVFRLGMASSIRAARQLVSHKHILVNGVVLNIGSAIMAEGATISITEKAKENQAVIQATGSPRLEVPDFLRREDKGDLASGVLQAIPTLAHIPFEFEPGLFTEYYAARKV